jgi:GTP pyrophosphokinase
MRTLESMAPDKQKKLLPKPFIFTLRWRTVWIYNIKSELEDLSLKYNNPDVYNEITEKLELPKKAVKDILRNLKKKFLKIK